MLAQRMQRCVWLFVVASTHTLAGAQRCRVEPKDVRRAAAMLGVQALQLRGIINDDDAVDDHH
jgi:hypothetical protein